MKLIDDSPGLFILIANVVVFTVIGVEIVMWSAPTAAVVTLTLALIAVTAVGIGAWFHHLLEDEEQPAPQELTEEQVESVQYPTRAPLPA